MSRLIDAGELERAVMSLGEDAVCNDCAYEFVNLIDSMPTIATDPVRHGRWIKVSGYITPGGDPLWKCSECGKGLHLYGVEHGSYGSDVTDSQWVACPNCGAKMMGEEG